MQFFLSGGGDAKQSFRLDALLANRLKKKRKILYIPTAMPQAYHSYGECYDWISKTFAKHGIKSIDMWTDLNGRNWRSLKSYGAVYIGGGNTFALLKALRDSGFDKMLLHYAEFGGIVYGGSAGAIVLGKDIGTAYLSSDADKNLVHLKQLRGLGFLGKFSVFCHYERTNERSVMKYVKTTGFSTIALPEEVGVYVHGKGARVVGYKDAYLFTKRNKIVLKRNRRFRVEPA